MYPYPDTIDRQISELMKLKNQAQYPPIQNFIQTGNVEFEAKMLNSNERLEDIIVQRKTAFIDLNNCKLTIKELDGRTTTYEIVKPKDAKDLEIERLKQELFYYKNGGGNE